MIITKDDQKVSDKIQHPFMIKTLQKMGIEGTYLNIVKPYIISPQQTFSMVKKKTFSMVKN